MPEPIPSDYEKEQQWRKDVMEFAKDVRRHWIAFLGAGIVSCLISLATGLGFKIAPSIIISISICGGLIVASFCAWREQKRIVEAKELELQTLKRQIHPIKAELNDREVRKKLKQDLGKWRLEIKGYYDVLSGDESLYDSDDRKRFEQDYDKSENAIADYLYDGMGSSEVASFMDNAGITKIDPESAKILQDSQLDRKIMLNRLEYRLKQLGIIEAKLDSKDFILTVDNPTV